MFLSTMFFYHWFTHIKTTIDLSLIYHWFTHIDHDDNSNNVGKTMLFLPPMTGNGNHTTHKNGDDWGGGLLYSIGDINSIIK